MAALEAGKHLFVEKPLAVTVAEARRIVAAARGAGTRVMVGHGARFSRIFIAIHELVRSGRLGEACYVEGDYVHDLGPLPRPAGPRLVDGRGQRGTRCRSSAAPATPWT